jgi:hypothetical protein
MRRHPADPSRTGRTSFQVAIVILAVSLYLASLAVSGADAPAGFAPIFDGRTLNGWHISATNHHGSTPQWRIEKGVLIGAQHPPGHGGLLLTNKAYHNVELSLDVEPDYGCDGGIFFRSDEQGRAYQVTLDYLDGGNVGGIYGEGLEHVTSTPAENWKARWKAGGWNSIRARIEGDTPHIQVWLNGRQIVDWADTANHAAGGATFGMIGLQVHGGGRWKDGGVHRFRAIAVKELP